VALSIFLPFISAPSTLQVRDEDMTIRAEANSGDGEGTERVVLFIRCVVKVGKTGWEREMERR